ncbi:MAG: TatD family hydrolase [Patescibacteria group bacterium]|nr:TatD family hydrolase [Patescibacteria group bacterium]
METASFLDAHTHAQFPAYDADRESVLQRARDVGVKMINVGTQFSTSEAAIKLAERFPKEMWAAIGFHPAHAEDDDWHHDKNEQAEAEAEVFDVERLRKLAQHPKVVAIGECGLDYFREARERKPEVGEKQKNIFQAQIELAAELDKPLMIHCRNAFPDLIGILSSGSRLPASHSGIIHFFTGTPDDARALLDLGFSFTFGGVITFAQSYDEVIKLIPIDRILSETDAPYVAPVPYRGKRNEPAYVVEVVKRLAELKGVSTDEMKAQIWKNAVSAMPGLIQDPVFENE